MKLLIASDIHGSAKWCGALLEAWRAEAPERLVLLGDLLYHGPRNDLPEDYAPKRVIEMLNGVADHILCVRGNCEAEVDQMVLAFPVMADYAALIVDGRLIYCTHGHVYNPDHLPPLRPGDALLFGHTHVPGLWRKGDIPCANPGSVSIPKQDSPHSYCVLEGGVLAWKDLATGETWRQERLYAREA